MGSVIWRPTGAALVEGKESGQLELGETTTLTKVYRGSYSLCSSSALAKGTIGTGAMAGWIVAKSQVAREQQGVAKLTIVWEPASWSLPWWGSQPLPPDEVSLEPFELNPALEKHPRYEVLDDKARENVRAAVDGATDELRDKAKSYIEALGDATQKARCLEMVAKLKKGIENYYLASFVYAHSFHSWTLPALTVGGFIQAPGGPLAGTFGGLSCLRGADKLSYGGGLWRVTRQWLCGPNGHWDADLYTA